jgi:hypothetical protein
MERETDKKPRRDLRQLQAWPKQMRRFEDAAVVEPFMAIKLCPAAEAISYTGCSSLELLQTRLEW